MPQGTGGTVSNFVIRLNWPLKLWSSDQRNAWGRVKQTYIPTIIFDSLQGKKRKQQNALSVWMYYRTDLKWIPWYFLTCDIMSKMNESFDRDVKRKRTSHEYPVCFFLHFPFQFEEGPWNSHLQLCIIYLISADGQFKVHVFFAVSLDFFSSCKWISDLDKRRKLMKMSDFSSRCPPVCLETFSKCKTFS